MKHTLKILCLAAWLLPLPGIAATPSAPAQPAPATGPRAASAAPARPAPAAASAGNFARLLGNSLAEAVDKAMPSVVVIQCLRFVERAVVDPTTKELKTISGRVPALGSGSIISPEGHVLTSNHVVEGKKVEIRVVTGDGQEYPAKIVGQDPKTDLAVLKIETPAGATFPVMEVFDSDQLRIGEIVIALGAPLGLDRSATFGIVSQKERESGQFEYEQFLQTDASINPGTSGGPVVNAEGRMVGVSAMIQTTGEGAGNIGIGFVVPSTMAMKVAKTLVAHGQMVRSYIGIAPDQVDPEKTSLPEGVTEAVVVRMVSPGSPAEKAGIQAGDLVLMVDDHPTPTVHEIKKFMHTHEPGDKVKFEIFRNGAKQTIEMTAEQSKKP